MLRWFRAIRQPAANMAKRDTHKKYALQLIIRRSNKAEREPSSEALRGGGYQRGPRGAALQSAEFACASTGRNQTMKG